VVRLQTVTRSTGPARYGSHTAAATPEVVSTPISPARISTWWPASASVTAQDSPTTPAPTTATRTARP
jgi:hypothetical protein